jgi:hypothetical protein
VKIKALQRCKAFFFDDLLRRRLRHFLDVHAAFAGRLHRSAACDLRPHIGNPLPVYSIGLLNSCSTIRFSGNEFLDSLRAMTPSAARAMNPAHTRLLDATSSVLEQPSILHAHQTCA